MDASRRKTPSGRLPVFLVTGFLGSGKTTLLAEIIKHPQMANSALVVNELGEIGIDHMILERGDENLVLLNSGCLCCAMLNTLPETLADLHFRRLRGEIPSFDRVIVETTGLAEPGPILRMLTSSFTVTRYYELRSVIVVADPVLGAAQLEHHPEVARQLAAADEVVLSKVDVATPDKVASFRERVRTINASARIHEIAHGRVPDPMAFLTSARPTIPDKSEVLPDWLGNSLHEHGQGHRHDGDIRSLSVVLDAPTSWAGYACWVDTLRQLPSESILRVKGVLNLREVEKPVVIHGVQHTFYRPSFLDRWPNAGRKSQIVFITWKLNPMMVQRSLEAFKVTPGSETKLDLEILSNR